MPELPEVEAARAAIAEHCIGKTIIKSIIANDSKVINGVSPSLFQASILNKTIIAAHRKGKNMWLQLDSPPFPSFQFGMAGAVYIKGVAVTKYKRSAVNDTDEWPSKYSMFFVELNDGLEISFTDKRRFATVRLLEDPTAVLPISALGPDALLEPMTEVEFFSSLNKKKIAIKALLLDQSFISGIGNWIADEVLYQARIHPSQGASSLSKDESARLLKCIKEVIHHAVQVDADSQQFPLDWLFHYRWGKKPGKVDGKKIDFIKVGGRTTAYVPEFQKLNGEQATEAPPNPRKKASGKNNNDDYGNDDEDGMEEERESAKSEKAKNKRSGNQSSKGKKSTKNNDNVGDDEKIEKDITGLGNGKATAKRKSLGMEESKNLNKSKKSRGGRKKATSEAKLENNNDSDNDEDGSGSEDQKKPTRAKPQKPQKQTKKKAK